MNVLKFSAHRFRPILSLILLTGGFALLLAACGDTIAGPSGPTPVPTPSLKLEANTDLFFVMSVPLNWNKKADKDLVSYQANDVPNLSLSVTIVQAPRLTFDSTRVLQEKLDSMKFTYPQFRQDNAGAVQLVNGTVNLLKIRYVDSGADFTEYLTEVNTPLSDRAYLLSGKSLTAEAEQHKTLFVTSFESFKSNAPLSGSATQTAGSNASDALAQVLNSGGKVSGSGATPGKVATFVTWQSPPLPYDNMRLTVNGKFPQDWNWRYKPFPALDRSIIPTVSAGMPVGLVPNPGLYLDSPASDALIQLGIVPKVFKGDVPASLDEYKQAIDPYLKSFDLYIYSLGSRTAFSELVNVNTLFRQTFIARSDAGVTNARGTLIFRSAGPHLLVGAITLSAGASLKPDLIDGYDADIQTLMNSLSVNNG